MAELHIIGQITGAVDFKDPCLFCKWSLQTGPGWRIISGYTEGQTKSDKAYCEEGVNWSHPVDVHYATRGLQGWPKIHVQVHTVDHFNRTWPVGYGFVHVPSSPGTHTIDCATWAVKQSPFQNFKHYFLGGAQALVQTDLVHSGLDRYKLNTKSTGVVQLELSTIFKNFSKFGVEYK